MDNQTPVRKQTEEFITITDLWHQCRANWNWFVVSVAICFIAAFYYVSTAPRIYKSEAAILVKQDSQSKNGGKSSDNDLLSDVSVVQQQTNVPNVQRQLVSLKVLSEVAHRLDKEATDEECLKIAQDLARRLKVKVEDDKSSIISLSITAGSTLAAEQILDTTVQVFNEQWLADKNRIAATTSTFIQERLKVLERELGTIDDNISNFKASNKITDIERISDIYLQQQSASDAQILTLSNQKSIAQYILSLLNSKDTQHQLLPTNTGINNETAEAQITQYNNLILQLKNSMYSTSSQNPLIVKQEADLAEIRRNIIATIQNHIRSLDIQLATYTKASSQASSKITQNPTQAKHLLTIEREQKVKESLYLYLLQKNEETEIGTTYTSFITEMIDPPHGSEAPISPNSRNIYVIAVLFGLMLPAGFLFMRMNLDNTVRDRSDIERKSNLTLIGEVPLYEFDSRLNRIAKLSKTIANLLQKLSLKRKQRSRHNPLVVQPGKQDLVNEAFRVIRTNLEFMTSKQSNNNVYIITSNYPGSGKTFVSMNLALALAIKGKHVLLIDGDLRHASTSRYFQGSKVGIADYLAYQETDIERVLLHHDEYPTLDVLPVGTIPPNPTELLASDRLSELIEEMRPRYDFIIIDSPPTETMADAGIIERQADRTIFVVRAGLFERNRIEDLEADAASGKYKNMSIVLNGTKLTGHYGSHYGYKYDYQYSYHGDDETEEAESSSHSGCIKNIIFILLCLAFFLGIIFFLKSCLPHHEQSADQEATDSITTLQTDTVIADDTLLILPPVTADSLTPSAPDSTAPAVVEEPQPAVTAQEKPAAAEPKKPVASEPKKPTVTEQNKQKAADPKKTATNDQKNQKAAEQKKTAANDQKNQKTAEQNKQKAAEQKKTAANDPKNQKATEQNKGKTNDPSKTQATEPKKEPEPTTLYTIVLGSFSKKESAQIAADEFTKQGFKDCHVTPSGKNFGVGYSTYKTKEEADAKLKQLRQDPKYSSCWILKIK